MAKKALSLGYFVMMQIRAGLKVSAQGGVYPFGTYGPDDAQRLATARTSRRLNIGC